MLSCLLQLAVAYAVLEFQGQAEGACIDSYTWDVANPGEPEGTLSPKSALVCVAYNLKDSKARADGSTGSHDQCQTHGIVAWHGACARVMARLSRAVPMQHVGRLCPSPASPCPLGQCPLDCMLSWRGRMLLPMHSGQVGGRLDTTRSRLINSACVGAGAGRRAVQWAICCVRHPAGRCAGRCHAY
jgi:hypothetical protein